MLTARTLARLSTVVGVLLAAGAVGVVVDAVPAFAGTIQVCPTPTTCQIIVTTPGGGGGGGGTQGGGGTGGGDGGGDDPDGPITLADQCELQEAQPQPPAGDPAWDGHKPGDGAIFRQICPLALGVDNAELFWAATPAAAQAAAQTVDPYVLAARAIGELVMTPPTIHIAPPSGSEGGLVGLPVWFWDDDANWTTVSDPVEAGGLSVIAYGHVTKVVWTLGDGTTLTCQAGTPWTASAGARRSPDCGHIYPKAGSYVIRAVRTYSVYWTLNGGDRHDIPPVIRTNRAPQTIAIRQLDVLVR